MTAAYMEMQFNQPLKMVRLGRPLARYLKILIVCLTSVLGCILLKSVFFDSKCVHVTTMIMPKDLKDQISLKSLVLSHRNKVDSAVLLANDDDVKTLNILMERKDCKLLDSITDEFKSQSIVTEKIKIGNATCKFPLLSCPAIPLVKNLIDHQLTFGLLKPDILQRNLESEIIRFVEEKGLTILSAVKITFSQQQAAEFYIEHRNRPFYNELVEYMTSGPSLSLIMSGKDGVRRWRDLMGPTDPVQARRTSPKSIRAIFGISATRNSCHGSDSWKAASREIIFSCRYFEMISHKVR